MSLLTPGLVTHTARTHPVRVPSIRVPLESVAFVASALFTLLFADAVLHDRAFFDWWLLVGVQETDFAGLEAVLGRVNTLTSSHGVAAGWLVMLVGLVVLRRWIAALAVSVMPVGWFVNKTVGMLSQHERPEGAEFLRTVQTDAASFPSGHVLGAVLLYGLVFALAGQIRNSLLRGTARVSSASVLVLVGPARLWEGAHWPSDVLGAYALGALLLTGILAIYFRADRAWGRLPLIRQAPLPHDETQKHAHALTSTVLFSEDSVVKIYAPG